MESYQNIPYTLFTQRSSSEYIQATQNYTLQFTSALVILLRIMSEGVVALFIVIFLALTHGPALVLLITLLGNTKQLLETIWESLLMFPLHIKKSWELMLVTILYKSKLRKLLTNSLLLL